MNILTEHFADIIFVIRIKTYFKISANMMFARRTVKMSKFIKEILLRSYEEGKSNRVLKIYKLV